MATKREPWALVAAAGTRRAHVIAYFPTQEAAERCLDTFMEPRRLGKVMTTQEWDAELAALEAGRPEG